ncbi:hypothetical protein SDC9_189660 [bioreactor metagenome]|uniref:Uncharacterized protein n=1 Tax=bioreactor metagenome TaxID=1076179 RepID=A0A645I0Y9_9ZZZZ
MSSPLIRPYKPISTIIETPIGNNGGIPVNKLLNNGVINPTANPHGPPKRNPAKKAGKCNGDNVLARLGTTK